MSLNLFLRPTNNAKVSYEYKTDVLSTYNNSEDRIAQRDIPRITFQYSYGITDYKSAYELENSLQNTGNAGSIFVPDWFCGIEIEDIQQGVNTIEINQFSNLAKNQYVMLLSDNGATLVSQISERDDTNETCTITFNSTTVLTHVYMYPLFECEVENDTTANRINPLTNTFELEVMVKTPVFSPLLPHNVQFLGHDVFCDDLQIVSSDNQIKSYQEVQENDYEIGVKDRFTFFSRMYNQFSATILSDQDRLEYTRNFIKRRWGKTFACFIPSGVADIAKHEYSTDELTDAIYVKKSNFDFESRPFIAVSHGDRITYAHVTSVTLGDVYQALTIDSETVTTVVLDTHNNVTSVVTGGDLGFTSAEIDSIQSLLFARLDDDTVDFTYAGSSADNKGLYSIELSFVETDFYDSSLISYETVEGKITDKLTLFEVKAFEQALMPNDITDNDLTTTSVYTPSYITGKYENTYAFSSVGIMDRETYPSTSSSWDYLSKNLIDPSQDFCLQIEGKFNNIEQVNTNSAVSYLARSLGVGFSIEVWNVYGSYDMYVSLSPFSDTFVGAVRNTDNIRITKYDGAITDWHEFAIQRVDGVTYVYCDGYLNGSSTVWQNCKLFRAVVVPNSRKIQYLILGRNSTTYNNYYTWYNANSFSYVQQARLTIDRHVYSGTTMSKSNRVYHLNDYELTELEPMDTATITKFDFKGISSFGRWYINYSYANNYNMNLYSCDLAQHPYAMFTPCVVDNRNDGMRYTSQNMTYKTDKLNLSSANFYLPYHKYKLPVTWNKSLWMEFEFKKNGTVKDGTVVLKADGIMLTAYVNSDESKWTFGAFGLNPVEQGLEMFDTTDSINVVIFIDCSLQGCTAGLYINGSKYIYDDMANIITKTERGRIGFSPFYMGNVNIDLTKFRLVDACLTHDNTYDVEQSWKLGYTTTYFDFEFGKKQTDTYPTLRIVNIDNIYPLANIYKVIKNKDYCSDYLFLWSDGSRGQQIVNPAPNTLYTVVVTNRTTGEQGFGWFYVYAGYTGEVCRSDFDYTVEYDNDGNLIQTDYIQGVRYNFLTKAYETYNPVYLRNYLTVENTNGGGKIACNQQNAITFLDFFGSDGDVRDIGSGGYQWYCYHRWFLECYVKQIELVVTLKDFSTTNFYTSGTKAYYKARTLSTLKFNGGYDYDVEAETSTQLDYLDYYNSDGVTVEYRQHYINSTNLNKCCSTTHMYHTPKYTLNYQQGITYQGVFIGYNGGQGYWENTTTDLPRCCYTLFETTPPKALHFVLEPDVVMLPYGGSYSSGQIGVIIKNIWVNGKKYDMLELTKEMSITYGDLQPLPTNPNEFTTYLLQSSVLMKMIAQITGERTNGIEWFNKTIGSIGGNFNIGYSTFLHGIADVHIYDYVKYENDFDASAIIKKYS